MISDDLQVLDKQIETLMKHNPFSETEEKQLCKRAKEVIIQKSNVSVVRPPVKNLRRHPQSVTWL